MKEPERPVETKIVTVSTTDPECGLFHKGEYKVEFAYTAHVVCDHNNFVLACEVTLGNVHDSIVFDSVYEETVAVDAGYKTPWICKEVRSEGHNLSTAYKCPMSKKGFFRSYEYVYYEYYDCVICPNNSEAIRQSTSAIRIFSDVRKTAIVRKSSASTYGSLILMLPKAFGIVWLVGQATACEVRQSRACLRLHASQRAWLGAKLSQAKVCCHESEKAGNVGVGDALFMPFGGFMAF